MCRITGKSPTAPIPDHRVIVLGQHCQRPIETSPYKALRNLSLTDSLISYLVDLLKLLISSILIPNVRTLPAVSTLRNKLDSPLHTSCRPRFYVFAEYFGVG